MRNEIVEKLNALASASAPASVSFLPSETTPKEVLSYLKEIGYDETDRELHETDLVYLIYLTRKNKMNKRSDEICVNGSAESFELNVDVF